jgi:hypothetical protein
MFRHEHHRETLITLLSAKNNTVDSATANNIRVFVETQRDGVLKPYVPLLNCGGGRVKLGKVTPRLRRVLAHWASPAPELILIPASIFNIVRHLLEHKALCLSSSHNDMMEISKRSTGLRDLILEDREASKTSTLSDQLLNLLRCSLALAEAALVGKTACITKKYESQHTAFEDMVRTGTWAPHHPVTETLPYFKNDYLDEQANARYQKDKTAAREEALKELRELALKTGMTCNKHKTRHRALTAGLFTVFCLGCGVCEAFEMMRCSESPRTPFRMFAQRKWHLVG